MLRQDKHGGRSKVQGRCGLAAGGGCHKDGTFTPAAAADDYSRRCAQLSSEHSPQHAFGTSCGHFLKSQAIEDPSRHRVWTPSAETRCESRPSLNTPSIVVADGFRRRHLGRSGGDPF